MSLISTRRRPALLILAAGLALLALAPAASAQQVPPPEPDETLFSGKLSLGGVAEVGLGATTAFGLIQPTLHAGGSFVLDGRWLIGGFWQQTLGEGNPDGEVDPTLYYDMTLIGGRVTHMWRMDRLVPVGVSLAGGWGEVDADVREQDNPDPDGSWQGFDEDSFYWIEPSVAAHLRFFEHLHLRMEAGYRIVGGVDYRAADAGNTSGAFIRLSVIGGYFGDPSSR